MRAPRSEALVDFVDYPNAAGGLTLVWRGRVFGLTLPLDRATEGCRAMDGRRAIKTLWRT